MTYITKTVDVEFDLSDFDDDELLEECKERNLAFDDWRGDDAYDAKELLKEIHDAYVRQQPVEVDRLLRQLFFEVLGRIT